MIVETIGDATLYLGDCLEILPSLGRVDAVVTDPPYGMNWDADGTRYTKGGRPSGGRPSGGRQIHGDDKPFDPFPWAAFDYCVLFGFNFYPTSLPAGGSLVWIKRTDAAFGCFLSDAEIAWVKGIKGVYCYRDTAHAITADHDHPSEKPVGLMEWAVEKSKAPGAILDPFMGSGTTGIACANLGRKFIGIEIDPKYFDLACRRIKQAYQQPHLFDVPLQPRPRQMSLMEES